MIYPDYNPQAITEPLTDAELEALDTLLAELPSDGAMTIEALDGYLTGLLLGPVLARKLRGGDWLPIVWGGDGPGEHAPFESNRQRKKVVVQALRHLRMLDQALHKTPEQWQPVVSVAESEEEEWVDASDWCIGFLQAMDLDREAWQPWLEHAEFGPRFVPMVLLGSDDSALDASARERLASLEVRDELSRLVLDTVQLLAQQTEPPAAN